jgi:MFS family permease
MPFSARLHSARVFTFHRFTRPSRWSVTTRIALALFLAHLYVYAPVSTLYFQKRGFTLAQINSIHALIYLFVLVFEVPTGIVADRFGRKWAIVLGFACQLAGEVLTLFMRSYWMLVLTCLVAGLNWSFWSGAIEALIFESLPQRSPEERAAAMKRAGGVVNAAKQAGTMVAFAAAGLLFPTLEEARFRLGILITCVAVGAGLLVSLTISEKRGGSAGVAGATAPDPHDDRAPDPNAAPSPQASGPTGSLALLSQGVRLLRTDALLRRLVLLSLFTNGFELFLFGLIQPQLARSGLPGFLFGPAFGLASLLALLGTRYSYLVDRLLGPRVALLLATALPGALYLGLGASSHPGLVVALFCLQSGAMALKGPLFGAYTNARVPDTGRATTLSVISLFGSLYTGVMGLAIGWVADASLRGAFSLVGTVVLAGALLLRIDDPGGAATPATPETPAVPAATR